MRQLFLCGAGNSEGVRLALRINEVQRRWDAIALLDDDPARLGHALLGVPVLGGFELLEEVDRSRTEVVNLIARTTSGRERAGERIASYGAPFAKLVSADVDLLGTEIAPDLIAYQNATLGPESQLEEGCVVFMGATVGHESHVGRYCVIAANAVLNARVRLGDGCYIGSGAVILPEVEIGAGVTVGAGAVVIGDVPAGATVVANMGQVARSSSRVPGRSGAGMARADLVKALTEIWCDVIGLSHVASSTNFFDCGGTSLLALRMLQHVELELDIRARLVDLFQYPSIDLLAAHLERTSSSATIVDYGRLRAERRRAATARLDRVRAGS